MVPALKAFNINQQNWQRPGEKHYYLFLFCMWATKAYENYTYYYIYFIDMKLIASGMLHM